MSSYKKKRIKSKSRKENHTITHAHERELLTIWRNHSRQNISCANCRKFQRQRATPTGISDMPVLRSAYKIVRKRNRQRDKLDRYVSDTAHATAMLVRIELSWVYLLEMGRLVATKKRNCVIHSDLCCQKLSAGFSILRRKYSAWVDEGISTVSHADWAPFNRLSSWVSLLQSLLALFQLPKVRVLDSRERQTWGEYSGWEYNQNGWWMLAIGLRAASLCAVITTI